MDVSARQFTAAIYARVSTEDQHCEMQLTELRQYVARSGWTVSAEYIDHGISGSKAVRPALSRLMKDASLKKFGVVLVWKLDRFGRSVQQLVDNIQILDQIGIRFCVPSQSIDTDQRNPTARLLLNILAVLADFERSLLVERVKAGVAGYQRAYKNGQIGKERHSRSGKDLAIGRPRKIFRRDEAARLRKQGLSWRAIAKKMGVPVSTIRDAIQDAGLGFCVNE